MVAIILGAMRLTINSNIKNNTANDNCIRNKFDLCLYINSLLLFSICKILISGLSYITLCINEYLSIKIYNVTTEVIIKIVEIIILITIPKFATKQIIAISIDSAINIPTHIKPNNKFDPITLPNEANPNLIKS